MQSFITVHLLVAFLDQISIDYIKSKIFVQMNNDPNGNSWAQEASLHAPWKRRAMRMKWLKETINEINSFRTGKLPGNHFINEKFDHNIRVKN